MLTITDIRASVLRLPRVDSTPDSSQDAFLVEVEADNGVIGIGESDTHPHVAQAVVTAPRSHHISTGLRDALVGQRFENVRDTWQLMSRATTFYGRRGVVIHAMAAVEMALWDLLGKTMGRPVYELLSDRTAASPAARYGTVLIEDAHADLEKLHDLVARRDLAALKLAWGTDGPCGSDDTTFLRRAREAVGPDLPLMVDVSCGWTAEATRRDLAEWRELGVEWIEEPFPPDRYDLYERLASTCPVPLAAGENESSPADFVRLLDAGVRVAQPDVSRCGLMAAGEVTRMASRAGVKCVPHVWSTGLVAAATHHCAVAYGWPLIESSMSTSPLTERLVLAHDPADQLPQTPGLGVHIDRDVADRYRDG